MRGEGEGKAPKYFGLESPLQQHAVTTDAESGNGMNQGGDCRNILPIFVINLFLSVVYTALSREIVFGFLLCIVCHCDFASYVYYLMCVCRI